MGEPVAVVIAGEPPCRGGCGGAGRDRLRGAARRGRCPGGAGDGLAAGPSRRPPQSRGRIRSRLWRRGRGVRRRAPMCFASASRSIAAAAIRSNAAASSRITMRNDDRLTVYSSTQTPHVCMRMLAELLGRDENQVRVVTPDVGGGFGPKLVFYQEEAVVALAALLLRPAGEVDRGPPRALHRDDPGARSVLGRRDRRRRGRQDPRLSRQLIHEHGAYTARGVNVPYGSGGGIDARLRGSGLSSRHQAGAHQQGAGDAGARRRPAAGRVRDGAHARPGRARARHRPRRSAPPQSHPGRQDAVPDRGSRPAAACRSCSTPATFRPASAWR